MARTVARLYGVTQMADVAVPVLVVGGGPVGLSTVIGLRRFGIACLLVERHPSTSLFPKGRAISTRTMEIFRQWGIEDEVTAAGLPREESLFIYLGDTLTAPDFRRFGSKDVGLSDNSPTRPLICSQDALEPVLRIYEGCGRTYLGEVEGANVLKIHRRTGKLSYLVYPEFEVVTARLTCFNSDLPSRLPFGNERGDFELDRGGPVRAVVALVKPTRVVQPPLGSPQVWRLVFTAPRKGYAR